MGWRQSLKLGRYEVIGLDIGSSAVKMVQLRKDNGEYVVTAACIADVGGGEDAIGYGRGNPIEAIRKCLASTGVGTRLAVCSVAGPEVAMRYFKFPPLPAQEIEGAVSLEAAQICPFNMEDGVVDYQLIGDEGDGVSGVLVAATNSMIRKKVRFARRAGLDCVLMDVDGLALLNCLSECEKAEAGRATAILNVGSSYTNLAIVGYPGSEGRGARMGLPFTRDTAYAGADIVQQMAMQNGLATEAVEKGLFNPGTPGAEAESRMGESLETACQKLIGDVTQTLRYYKAQKKAVVEKILVCGGFARAKGFVELLERRLSVEAELWNPLNKMRCSEDLDEALVAKHGPAMVVAAGLATRAV